MTPSVTVVIPTRNRLEALRRAVASVLEQEFPALELVVVDDASSDGTWNWLSTLADPRVRVFQLPQSSERAAARNRGLAAARGEFVMFLDDDDHLLPAALEQLVSAIRGCSSAVAVAGIRIDVSGAERWRPYPHPRRRRLLSIWPELVAGWIPAQGQYLCRTAVARQIGGWNEKVPTAEDVDLWLRLSRAGKILFIPVAVLCVDRSGSGRSHMHDVAAWWKRLRVQFVAELPAPAAELGQRILRAEDLGRGAQQAYRDGRYGRSFLAYLRLWRLVPELMSSPIVGRAYRTALVRAGVGVVLRKRGMGIAKDVAHRLRASS